MHIVISAERKNKGGKGTLILEEGEYFLLFLSLQEEYGGSDII